MLNPLATRFLMLFMLMSLELRFLTEKTVISNVEPYPWSCFFFADLVVAVVPRLSYLGPSSTGESTSKPEVPLLTLNPHLLRRKKLCLKACAMCHRSTLHHIIAHLLKCMCPTLSKCYDRDSGSKFQNLSWRQLAVSLKPTSGGIQQQKRLG